MHDPAVGFQLVAPFGRHDHRQHVEPVRDFPSFTAFSCSRIDGQRRDDAVMLKKPSTEV